MKMFGTVILLAVAAGLSGCHGYGPLGEPPTGVAGLKAAERQHETAKIGKPGITPRGGGSAIAPTGPDGDPTAGPTDSIGPH
jgi:predicted small lipoprotein YifL